MPLLLDLLWNITAKEPSWIHDISLILLTLSIEVKLLRHEHLWLHLTLGLSLQSSSHDEWPVRWLLISLQSLFKIELFDLVSKHQIPVRWEVLYRLILYEVSDWQLIERVVIIEHLVVPIVGKLMVWPHLA